MLLHKQKSEKSARDLERNVCSLQMRRGREKKKPTVGVLLDILVLDHMRRFYVYTLEA